MKKFTLTLFTTLLLINFLHAQSCLESGITLYDQASIDNFPVNYPDCIEILGDLTIGLGYDNDITNLSGLSNIQVIGGFLYFNENPNLQSMSGLDNLESVGGYLEIYGNESLNSLSGLGSLESIGGDMIFYENHDLEDFSGLDALTSVGGALEIGYHEALLGFNGLESLTSIGGMDLAYVSNMTDFTGLNGLTTITGDVWMTSCDAIESMNGFNALTEVDGSFYINGLVGLTSLSGFENLTTLTGELSIVANQLANLAPLNNLTSVGGGFELKATHNMQNLNGLENLTSVGGELIIGSNQALTSLSGIDNIEYQSITNLKITYNPMLSECEVISVCDYLSSPGGTIWLFDNASGCDSQEEVEEACQAIGMEKYDVLKDLLVYPNPFKGNATFSFYLEKPQWIKLEIFDPMGRKVYSLEKFLDAGDQQILWEAGNFPAGIYSYLIQTSSQVLSGKMALQK